MIDAIGLKPLTMLTKPQVTTEVGGTDLAQQFGSFLNTAMSNLSNQEAQVEQLSNQFISGNLADVHQLTIAAEKASLGLELTLQVRNKVIEAYQDVMRMQM
ncbi:flagellar hook-basal body complex protein FliE [Paenibacillus psychroresistens]|uniref:Flagellar hook-basal body complex protein FliE n=1 Tax=Paenibacillus psychroresistens TaxID=1778678 RepID=A0A6B8RK83_9BACL|nr:flagellar hook-basal body complex protein FliE [Paenibacillus psychroresistens]QGQ96227.1 flagellar hook-basal body complex protein FliE [Paenibacillus psychroresistens]